MKDQSQENTPTGKTYEIDSLEKLVNVVNKENFKRLSIDFINWLAFVSFQYEELRASNPELCEGKTNSEIGKSTFIWTDDGKEGITSAQFTNEQTGEKQTIEFENPFTR